MTSGKWLEVATETMTRPIWGVLFLLGAFGCAAVNSGAKGGLVASPEVHREAIRNAYQPKRLALVVGIDSFEHSEWRPLRFAVKDAEDVARFLSDPAQGHFDEVQRLTLPEKTNHQTILEEIDRLKRRNIDPDDTVLIYFSTHGTLAKDKEGRIQQYIVASDTDLKNIPESGVPLAQVKRLFAQFTSRRKVLILAFCYSGGGKSQLPSDVEDSLKGIKAPFFVKPLESVSEASVILSASAWGETANEDPQFKNDIYTHFLLEGMTEGDKNKDGAVTVSEAHDFARERTYYYTRGQQRPTAESEILGVDPIVLSGRPVRSGLPVLFDYSERFGEAEVLIDGRKKGILPSSIAVEPGRHHFALAEKGTDKPFFEETIRLQEGERLSIPFLIRGYEHDIAISAGYQSFLRSQFRKEVVRPLPLIGLTYTERDFFQNRYALALDIAYGRADQGITVRGNRYTATVTEATFGAAFLYQSFHSFYVIQGGPRLGGIYLDRKFDLPVSGARSSYFTATPGLLFETLFTYRKRLSVSLGGSINYVNLRVNNGAENLFYLDGTAKLIFHF